MGSSEWIARRFDFAGKGGLHEKAGSCFYAYWAGMHGRLSFEVTADGEKVFGEGMLYELEGAALYADAKIADITDSSQPVLFCAVSKKDAFLSRNVKMSEEQFLFTCVVRMDDSSKILVIKMVLEGKNAKDYQKGFQNTALLSMEEPLYEKLAASGRWETEYIAENRQQTEESVTADDFSKPAFVYGTIMDSSNGAVVGCFIRDTWKDYHGSYISQIAEYEIYESITGNGMERKITFQVMETGNYLVIQEGEKEPETKEAPSGQSYVLVKEPLIGLRVVNEDDTAGSSVKVLSFTEDEEPFRQKVFAEIESVDALPDSELLFEYKAHVIGSFGSKTMAEVNISFSRDMKE